MGRWGVGGGLLCSKWGERRLHVEGFMNIFGVSCRMNVVKWVSNESVVDLYGVGFVYVNTFSSYELDRKFVEAHIIYQWCNFWWNMQRYSLINLNVCCGTINWMKNSLVISFVFWKGLQAFYVFEKHRFRNNETLKSLNTFVLIRICISILNNLNSKRNNIPQPVLCEPHLYEKLWNGMVLPETKKNISFYNESKNITYVTVK